MDPNLPISWGVLSGRSGPSRWGGRRSRREGRHELLTHWFDQRWTPIGRICAQRLTKTLGDKAAVNGIDFTVEPGRVTSFLGPNGAGRSATMRMILRLDAPTSGQVSVNGHRYAASPAPLRETTIGTSSRVSFMSLVRDDVRNSLGTI